MKRKDSIMYIVLLTISLALATKGFTDLKLHGLLLVLLVTFIYFMIIFVIATMIKNNSIVDMGWGPGFVIGAWISLVSRQEPSVLSYIVVGFITIWGLRLGYRITKRNWKKPEDFRYANWRKEWGKNVVFIAFFKVFMIQAIINFLVGSVSYIIVLENRFDFQGFGQVVVYLGLVLSLIGLFFEVVGDEQLRRHIKQGTRTLMNKGLWSITRHPNYFGEIMIWVGLYVAGVSLVISSAVAWYYYLGFVISPAFMAVILIRTSTPLLEKNMAKYDGWETYVKKTPMIFPFIKH